jgi:hypothetical protein
LRSFHLLVCLRIISQESMNISSTGSNQLYAAELGTRSKHYAVILLHYSQVTIGHTMSSQSVTVFSSRCLVAASNGGHPPSSGFPNCPRPQLASSHSNSSQQLNRSSSLNNLLLTDSLTNSPQSQSQSQSYVTTAGQSTSLSWCQAASILNQQHNPSGHLPELSR